MYSCEHKCLKCGEEWVCEFPYFSNHNFFEEAVQSGSYCNAWCPSCNKEERKDIKNLFESGEEQNYLNPTSLVNKEL